MSLASPGWLLLSALGLVVVFLHLRRRRTFEVSSIRLWQRIADASRSRASARVRPNLLMALQLAAVLLIALALARPFWGGAQTWDHWIVVLDASGSMQATDLTPSRFSAAGEKLRHMLAEEWGDKGRVSLIVAGPRPYVAAARRSSEDSLLATLDRVQASAGPTSWQQAAELIPSLMVGDESVRISVLSDTAGKAAASRAITAVMPNATVESVAFGSSAGNTGLIEASASLLDPERGRWQVSGQLQRFSDEAGTVPVTILFRPQGTEGALEWGSEQVEVQAGERASFSSEVRLPGPGVLEIRLPDDTLAQDNHAFFVLRREPRVARVLHIGPDNPPLQRALHALSNLELYEADALPESDATYDLVIVDRTRVPRQPDTNTLWLGVMPEGRGPAQTLRDPTPSGWRNDHPLSESVDWSKVSVASAQEMPRLPGAEVLLEASGAPLLQVRTGRYGREIVTAFALRDSNWPDLLGFPTFVANLVHWLVPDLGRATVTGCQAGEACPLEPRWALDDARLVDPQGKEVPLPYLADDAADPLWLPERSEISFRPDQAGLYTLLSDGTSQQIAVNDFDPGESDLRATGTAATGSPASRPAPLWLWPLLLALLALIAEGWLAGRTSERFLRPSSLARGNPLAPRRRLILVLRLAALAFLAMALLGVPGLRPTGNRNVVFVVDDPQLYDASSRQLLDHFVSSAVDADRRGMQSGLVRLGKRSQVARDLSADLEVGPGDLHAEAPGADLESGLSLAAGMLPGTEPGRIIVAASGMETQGRASEALQRLVARGIPVDVYPVGGIPEGELLAEDVSVPSRLHQDDPFVLQGVVFAERAASATVRILREGKVLTEQAVDLLPGRNRIEASLEEDEPGSYLYEMEVSGDADVFAQNNRAGVVAEVSSGPHIAIFTPQPAWGEIMANALKLQGLSSRVMTPDQIPWQLEDWLAYDVAILMNVPAIDLHSQQQDLLESWVKDFGGGLVLLGGENTFGPGGYYQTAFERLSPLSSRVPQEAPKVAMLFVLDRSGSMQQRVGDVTRLDIAKDAAGTAIDLLNPQSLAGIVAFDSEASLLAPMQSVRNKDEVRAALSSLQPGGGTSLYPALVEAYAQMAPIDAMARHIVVMTDGLSQPGDFGTILKKMADANITVSTVAIGQGADTNLLQSLARLGGGAFHATTDFRALPSILAQEALSLSNRLVKRKTFVPAWTEGDAPFVMGMSRRLPPLHGYVATKAKPSATVELRGPEDAPLLASWRYGLGRVAAFASHGAGAWASDWLNMPAFPLLWSQVVRWALPATVGPGLHLEVERKLDTAQITAEAVRPDGKVDSGRKIVARIAPAEGTPFSVVLSETEPGRYEGSFAVASPKRYQIEGHVENADGKAAYGPASVALQVSYPARYLFSRQGTDTLAAVARATGGRVLLGDEPVFPGPAPLRWQAWSAWPLWALVALALFVVDLLVRYAPQLSLFGRARRKSPGRSMPTAE